MLFIKNSWVHLQLSAIFSLKWISLWIANDHHKATRKCKLNTSGYNKIVIAANDEGMKLNFLHFIEGYKVIQSPWENCEEFSDTQEDISGLVTEDLTDESWDYAEEIPSHEGDVIQSTQVRKKGQGIISYFSWAWELQVS